MVVPPQSNGTAAEAKVALRRAIRAKRHAQVQAMSLAERCCAAVLLAGRVCERLSVPGIVSAYLPQADEIDPLPLLERLTILGWRTALPFVTDRRSEMSFLDWSPGDTLKPGPFALLQPKADAAELTPDVILTPLLAFDGALNRLGQGAGFYDRAFARLPNAQRIGLAWSMQQVASCPVDPWDVTLHAIVTENGWIEQ